MATRPERSQSSGLSSLPADAGPAVWALRGDTALLVECWITGNDSAGWTVTVTYGADTVLNEQYADAATALHQARAVQEQLIERGWKPEPPPWP
jgi:hypothetical protein